MAKYIFEDYDIHKEVDALLRFRENINATYLYCELLSFILKICGGQGEKHEKNKNAFQWDAYRPLFQHNVGRVSVTETPGTENPWTEIPPDRDPP